MRKITRQIVWLFVIFVIYFGYSAFIDGVALYHLNQDMEILGKDDSWVGKFTSGVLMGSSSWNSTKIYFENNTFWLPPNYSAILKDGTRVTGSEINKYIGGLMAPNSLLYTILMPFKLVLVGAAFASLIPLVKSIFLGTFIGIKTYRKTRQPNVLFNYEATINYTEELKKRLEADDYNQIKAQYKAFSKLVFQPTYLKTMMEGIGDYLIKERDTKIFINPCQVEIDSLKEMYYKERQTFKNGKPVEWFFDLKMGYDYTSIGSKYNIAYFKALSINHDEAKPLAWKLFSLEMYRFYLFMFLAIIPTIIFNVILLPLIGKGASGKAASYTAPGTIILSFFLISIIFHSCFTLTKKQYRHMKYIWIPAVVYYLLIVWLAISFIIGINGVQSIGPIYIPGTSIDLMWPFFAALGYTILSTCLILFVISTLMDNLSSPEGLNIRSIINGICLPIMVWIAATTVNFVGILGDKNMSLFSGIAFALVAGYWIYLTVASLLANNLIPPKKVKPFSAPKSGKGPQSVLKK